MPNTIARYEALTGPAAAQCHSNLKCHNVVVYPNKPQWSLIHGTVRSGAP